MRTTIVIPTYNEKESLSTLVKRIFQEGISDLSVLIVDDNSPDGTGALADQLAKKYPLAVIHRVGKSGIGKAYQQAFKYILQLSQDLRPDVIIQMDADLSHDPSVIHRMLDEMQKHDLVLGSRYIQQGEIRNWNFFRRLISRFGNVYAQVVLWLPYKDLTSGFKCFTYGVLRDIDLDSLNSIGYCFQIETTYKAHKKKYRITEIPISFTERKLGSSKFNLGIILESFFKVFLLRFRK